MDLDKWEERFRPYLPEIEIIGEIPLTQAEHTDLEKDLAAFVRRHGLTEATRRLRERYPASFVVYLAFKAAFNDERSFWDRVADAMGVSASFHQETHHWGKTFRSIIRQYPNLRQFKNISGRQFVTPIRLHGGIPAYSLPDFFRFILLPSVEKSPYDGMEDKQALNELLEHYTTTLFVDSVVRYFFRYGGTPAQRLFTRSRRMARLARANKPLPAPSELGLRPYLVLNFENYLQNPPERGKRRQRPRIYIDPYFRLLFRVVLPPQPLTLEQASRPCQARLLDPNTNADLGEPQNVRTYRRGLDWLTEEIEWSLDEPVENIQVELYIEGEKEPVTLYTLRIIPRGDFPPILAARYEDGALRPISPALKAKTLWLIYPSDAELYIEGEARQIERMHPYAPPWDGWQAQAWDLSKARLVRLVREGSDICPPIPVTLPDEPTLLGEPLHQFSLPIDEKPLYRTLPRLRLPLRHRNMAEQELSDWELRLESRYAAFPSGEWQGCAADLPHEILEDEFAALVDLSHWLGEVPAGTYHLTLNGRGYPEMELPFRVCTQVSLDGLEPYYLPDNNGAKAVRFYVHLPKNASLSIPNNPPKRLGNRWRVDIPEEDTQTDLEIVIPSQPEDVRIPLRITIPRLQWTLILQPGEALNWHHQPISLPLPRLLQIELARFRPRLRVKLALPHEYSMQAALHLRLPDEEESLHVSDKITLSRTFQDFDLSPFLDTLRTHAKVDTLTFVLELQDDVQKRVIEHPLVYVNRDPNIKVFHLEQHPNGYLTIHWYEPEPLRYRRLRLWNLWQPWAEPAEIPIPDDAPPSDVTLEKGWWMHDLPPDISIPPSEYRMQFVIIAPYQKSSIPSVPPPEAIPVSLIRPTERLRQIKAQLVSSNEKNSREFALHIEKACIYQSLQRSQDIQQEIQWCLSHWRQANLLHLEALQRWLQRYDPETSRAFLIYMFRKESLEKLRRHSPSFIARYLENFPAARTVKPENAPLILEIAREPAVILRALRLLAQSDHEEAIEYFWKALEEHRFSESDAADVLAEESVFAQQLLRTVSHSPLRTRLIRELSRRIDIPAFMVKIGHYVLSPAGWAEITEIHQARSPAAFMPDTEHPTLRATLLHWPEQQVELNLAEGTLTILGRAGVYQCICKRFVVPGGKDGKPMWKQHKMFCHVDVTQPRPVPAVLSFPSNFVIFTNRIDNPFDTRNVSGE
ncbi:MAG: hypothetical protein D6694_05270 [Gammaproteobacteria bacterium]|nr:MAG: hypothetical protein D6694_05270 [Gammaproteobacteria bacterium]